MTQLPSTSACPDGFVEDIRPWLHYWHNLGLPLAVITLVNVEGNSPRPVGSQLVVNALGQSAGLISGGCLEAALIEEAQACIETNESRIIRYGKDSDYFDIQLPCGSGVDVLITPHPDDKSVNSLYEAYQKRFPVAWTVSLKTGKSSISPQGVDSLGVPTRTDNPGLGRSDVLASLETFTKVYRPVTRMIVTGRGSVFEELLKLAALFDMEIIACTPDFRPAIGEESAPLREKAKLVPLPKPNDFDATWLDSSSALVTTFHDHEWEFDILQKAVRSDAFYITALGSRSTHAARRQSLETAGVPSILVDRVKGPAGLDIGSQSPPEIALAIMAELVSHRNART